MSKTVLGLDRIGSCGHLFNGRKIGLITNFSGIDSEQNDNISLFINHGYNLVRLFTPEHGLYGAADGEAIEDSVHEATGLPVISLYGSHRQPTEQDLMGIDTIVFDIQDLGLRYYTYIYTLAYVLEAAARYGKEVVVLDRPNPLGNDTIIGSRIPERFDSFVGSYKLPIRYGLTIGEVGKYFVKLGRLDVKYSVVELKNYKKSTYFPDTGLIWNVPSPAIPSFNSTLGYCGGCFFESINVSEGRGTPRPFQFFGAPYINMDELFSELKRRLPINDGFAMRKRAYMPNCSKYKNEVCFGVEVEPLTKKLNFIPIAIEIMAAIRALYPDDFRYIKYADVARVHNLTGDERVRDYVENKGITLNEILGEWRKSEQEFASYVSDIRIYK